jgi:uncharacterized NAD(P)/FAD-binding protein YdhS
MMILTLPYRDCWSWLFWHCTRRSFTLTVEVTSPIVLIGSSPLFGNGIAYSSLNPLHLLNVRAKGMSAFPLDQDHFVKCLVSSECGLNNSHQTSDINEQFIPRYIYGHYLHDILTSMLKPSLEGTNVELIEDEAIAFRVSGKQLNIMLQSKRSLNAEKMVLAHGHLEPKCHIKTDHSIPIIANPWNYKSYKIIPKK